MPATSERLDEPLPDEPARQRDGERDEDVGGHPAGRRRVREKTVAGQQYRGDDDQRGERGQDRVEEVAADLGPRIGQMTAGGASIPISIPSASVRKVS
jgi:hypothetical protein